MTEWEFTADVASWINELLRIEPDLPFERAKCEQRGAGSQKRRDITLLDKQRRPCLTGEVKLPYRQDGSTPFISAVVDDARKKAQRAQVRFFFTWNVNQCVLWETSSSKTSLRECNYMTWDVTNVNNESQLENPITLGKIRSWLMEFLHEVARILQGTLPISYKSPDEKFIEALESSLKMPIMMTIEELSERYQKKKYKLELDAWMRDEQGWLILDDAEGIRDNLERAAKSCCYALVNRLVFYEALLKRKGTAMEKMIVPDHIATGEGLRWHLETYFSKAKTVTGDYETVFGEEHLSIGHRIPFYSDKAVDHWRVLINQIHDFDFSKIDYEVIGNIFERLIAPEERRKYGQFYTRVEVVDLINSFCIREGNESVMDPACGGGTFLVRAYARKKELDPSRKHTQRLYDLYGVDTSHFATHLTTINLATRELVEDENYPQILRSDFFDVASNTVFIVLPKKPKSKGLGKLQHREVVIPQIDAVVGNPPYIRQEFIRKSKGKAPEPGTKEYYQHLVREESGAMLSGRSDIHCYFWPHAASFLRDEGYLCFLTSSQWLDVEYGFRLQDWILRNFEIIAIFESVEEPWFVGARVTTTVTILRKQKDDAKRMNNVVRFVQLRRPIAEILSHDGTTAGAVCAANKFRDEILSLAENTVTDRFRARLVRQGELWKQGVKLGVIMGKTAESDEENCEDQNGASEYYGGKWGIYLRAPDLWFNLLDRFSDKLVPLGDIAEIRRGITSGKDSFFFPKDCSRECLNACLLPSEFQFTYGASRREVESGRVKLVRCGEGRGEIHPIESKYLEPEVHSLMEVSKFVVEPEDCSRYILLVNKKKKALKGTYVLKYIEWGENQGVHKGSTCSSRATAEREWYDLTGHKRGALFWPMAQQYKHVVPMNSYSLICNHNLFDISAKGESPEVLAGILNSSLIVLSKYQYGRPVGVEGNLKTEVIDVNMMLVPDVRKASVSKKKLVSEKFRQMQARAPLQFLSEQRMREMAYSLAGKDDELKELSDECELDMPDRRELDDAVLEMMGVSSKRERKRLIDELYKYLGAFFEWTRQKEERAIENKKRAKRRGSASPEDIAAQIIQEIKDKEGHWLRYYDSHFRDFSKPFDAYPVPMEGTAEVYEDILVPHGVRFVTPKKKTIKIIEMLVPGQETLCAMVANTERWGFVRIPHEIDECKRLEEEFGQFVIQRDQRLRELIEYRTADEELQEKVFNTLQQMLMYRNNKAIRY